MPSGTDTYTGTLREGTLFILMLNCLSRFSCVVKDEKPEDRDLLSDLQDISDSERKTSTAESSMGNLSLMYAHVYCGLKLASSLGSCSDRASKMNIKKLKRIGLDEKHGRSFRVNSERLGQARCTVYRSECMVNFTQHSTHYSIKSLHASLQAIIANLTKLAEL